MIITHDKVLVQEIEVKDRTLGGIYIPNQIGLTIKKGTVVAHGPGRNNEMGTRCEMGVKVGDVVMFAQHAGLPIEYKKNGETFKGLILPDVEIIGIFEQDEEWFD